MPIVCILSLKKYACKSKTIYWLKNLSLCPQPALSLSINYWIPQIVSCLSNYIILTGSFKQWNQRKHHKTVNMLCLLDARILAQDLCARTSVNATLTDVTSNCNNVTTFQCIFVRPPYNLRQFIRTCITRILSSKIKYMAQWLYIRTRIYSVFV